MRSMLTVLRFFGMALAAGLALFACEAPNPETPVVASARLAAQTGPTRSSSAQERSDQEAVELARSSANELTATLRNLLSTELNAGGPSAAIAACSTKAQVATQALAKENGVAIRRVSLQWRNPADEPDGYERKVLEEFEHSQAQKRLPAESVEFVTDGTARKLRFMKPITLAPMCTTCHGQPGEVPAEVQAVLREKYPNDTATGYRPGDLRGAISVTIPLSAGL